MNIQMSWGSIFWQTTHKLKKSKLSGLVNVFTGGGSDGGGGGGGDGGGGQ